MIVEYFPVFSKKLEKTVNIGIATTADIKNEFKYQILNLLNNILPLFCYKCLHLLEFKQVSIVYFKIDFFTL